MPRNVSGSATRLCTAAAGDLLVLKAKSAETEPCRRSGFGWRGSLKRCSLFQKVRRPALYFVLEVLREQKPHMQEQQERSPLPPHSPKIATGSAALMGDERNTLEMKGNMAASTTGQQMQPCTEIKNWGFVVRRGCKRCFFPPNPAAPGPGRCVLGGMVSTSGLRGRRCEGTKNCG